MQARLNAIEWNLDIDIINDDSGREYQIVNVQRDRLGRLSLTLDTNPIEDRLYIFQSNDYNWRMENQCGTFSLITDGSILSFLKELQATIPPLQIR